MKANNFRRIISSLLAICLLTSVLVACSTQDIGEDNDPTKKPTNSVVTDEPTDPTDAPTDPTDAPADPTDAPTDPTDAPTDPTEAPTDPTEAPTDPTEEPTDPPATEPPKPSDDVLNIVMPEPGPDGKFQADTQYIFGVCYAEDQMNNRVSVDQAVYLIRSLGVRSVRIWTRCYISSTQLEEWQVERLHDLIGKLHDADIQVLFFINLHNKNTPYPDYTEGSDYITYINDFGTLCHTYATEFPEVRYWELGNEWNHNPFLHPMGWTDDGTGTAPFTMKEKAQISADLMYMAKKYIRAAGSDGLIIAPAMAPSDGMDGVDMSDWLEYVYEAIETGATVEKSTNPRDFFEALAWHPYMVAEPDMEWVENNNRLYKIAVDHGDAGIKVFLTEYGFPDGGNSKADATQAEWMVKAYELVRRYMPYVESLHYYRLFTDTSRTADLYGLMHQPEDGFGPKAKALAYQKMAGGKGDLYKFYMPLFDEGEDNEE